MIKEAIDRILELGDPDTFKVGERVWRKDGYTEIVDPVAGPIKLNSLAAFADYVAMVEDNRDGRIIHVISPTRVEFLGQLRKDKNRECYAYASALIDSEFKTAQWHTQEDFVVSVQAHFVETKHRSSLLKIVGNVRGGRSSTMTDDGVTQKVATARGVELTGLENLPNPVTLQPWETFAEVEQPIRQYIVRVRGDETPQFALFAVPDPRATATTCLDIQTWLMNHLPEAFKDSVLG